MEGVDIPPSGRDQDRGPVIIAVLSLFFGLSTIIVFLRMTTRLWITRNFGWDDATMALTQVEKGFTWRWTSTNIFTGDKCRRSWLYGNRNLQRVWTS